MAASISVIVCTRNRAANLRPTLESVSKTIIPSGWEVELLVVDNGSSDGTSVVVNEARFSNVVLRYISEPVPGLCNARNTGIREAVGKIILFTDDDVRVPTNWIEGMCRPILEGEADAVQGGVKIAPHLDRPWLTGALRVWVASVEDPVVPPAGLVGANMAFERRVLGITGGFDPRLGAGACGFFEDTMFGWALERAGQRILYQPNVAVEHHFSADRLTFKAYFQTARRMAESRAIVMRILDANIVRPSLVSVLKELPGLAIRSITQIIRYMIDRRPDAGFVVRYFRIRLWYALRKSSL